MVSRLLYHTWGSYACAQSKIFSFFISHSISKASTDTVKVTLWLAIMTIHITNNIVLQLSECWDILHRIIQTRCAYTLMTFDISLPYIRFSLTILSLILHLYHIIVYPLIHHNTNSVFLSCSKYHNLLFFPTSFGTSLFHQPLCLLSTKNKVQPPKQN